MWTGDGWYWVSDEQWAWATYHYGRWVYDSYYGWVWTPDTEWGPSWVCWREGGGYVGWAPLPPGAAFGSGGDVIIERPVQDRFFVFVDVNHFSEPIHRRDVIVNKTTIINKTVNITRITRVNNVIVNHGPKFEDIQRVSTRKLTEPVPRAARPGNTETRTIRPEVAERSHQPVNEEKGDQRGPEAIHGTSATPSATPGATHERETEKKEPNQPRVEPLPTESKPPHEEHAVEKRDAPRQEERKEEKPQKSGPGGD